VLVALGTFCVAYAIAARVLYSKGQSEFLGALTPGTLELDRGKVVDAFAQADLPFAPAVAAVTVILGSLWIVLLVPSSAFGVKRALFNLHPTAPKRCATPASQRRRRAPWVSTPWRHERSRPSMPCRRTSSHSTCSVDPCSSRCSRSAASSRWAAATESHPFLFVGWSFVISVGALGLIRNQLRRRAGFSTAATGDSQVTRGPLALRTAYRLTMATLLWLYGGVVLIG
jgi:hypothetical protein